MTTTPTESTARVLHFEDVGEMLRIAGRRIGEFAQVVQSSYEAGGFDSTLMYRITVEAADGVYLCIDGHELAFGAFGVQGTLHMCYENAVCATWLFSDSRPSPLADTTPLCIKCLGVCDGGESCLLHEVRTDSILLDQLADAVVDWIRSELAR